MDLFKKSIAWGFTFMLLISFTCIVVGQDQGSITGTLYNNETKEILSGAEVLLSPANVATVSDPWGKFSFENLNEGKYELKITHVGFVEVLRNVTLRKATDLNLKIFLDENVRMIEGVEIITVYPKMHEPHTSLPYIKNVIGTKEINQSTANDIGDLLRGQPNVSGIRKGGTNIDPVVRGFKFSQLNVQVNNGIKIEGGCPNRMDPAIAHVEVEDIKSIEVLKGPYALRYGPSFGGVINLITKQPKPHEKFTIGVDAILGYSSNPLGLKQHLAIHGGSRHIFFMVAWNYNKFQDYKAGNGDFIPSSGLKYNALGQLGIAINKDHTILLSMNDATGRNIDFIALPMDLRTDDTRLYSLDYSGSNITNVFNSISLKVYRSDVDHVMDNKTRPFSDTIVAVTTVNAVVDGLRTEGIFEFERGKLFTGIDYKHIYKDGQRVKSAILQPTLPAFTEQIWNNAIINNLGFFAEYHYQSDFAAYIGTLRFDLNSANSDDIVIKKMSNVIYESTDNSSGFYNVSFSLGAKKDINDQFNLGLMLGRGVRSPNMTERFITLLPVGFDSYDYLGNPKLKPEINYEVDLTGRAYGNHWGVAELNVFYAYSVDFITGEILPPSVQKPLTKDVLGVKKFVNGEPVHFTGFELAYKTPSHLRWSFELVASYTYACVTSDTMAVYNDNNEIIALEKVTGDPLSEVPPFESTISFLYKLFGSKLIPKATLRLVAAQNHVSQANNEKTSPGFLVAGLSFIYQHNQMISVSGGVKNLFNNTYYEHLNRRIIGTKNDLLEPGTNFYINLIFNIQ